MFLQTSFIAPARVVKIQHSQKIVCVLLVGFVTLGNFWEENFLGLSL